MFARECTHCNKRMLVFPSQITGMSHTGEALEVSYECWCGATQTCELDATGNLRLAA